ncbi:MAG: hypothetical protein ABFR47_04330 [Verrucomicrobiota bacterium]
MTKKQKTIIGLVALAVAAAIWTPMEIANRKIRGKIRIRDAKTGQPVPSATILFEVSRTIRQVYPPMKSGFVTALETDGQGLAQVPDVSKSKWSSATYLRICVLSDEHKTYLKSFEKRRFGKDGSNCRGIKVKLERKR